MKKTLFILSTLIFVLLGTGCGRKGRIRYEDEAKYEAAPKMMAKSTNSNLAGSRYADMEADYGAEEAAVMADNGNGDAPVPEPEEFERKLIKTGNLTIKVKDLAQSEENIEKWAKQFGGYVSYSSTNEYNSYFTVKVPCQKFEQAMETAGEFGVLTHKDVNSQDVSEQFYDLKTRLETKKILQTNLKNYLTQAKNLKDILEIERELNNVTTEVESMEGQLRRLSSRIDFSTINISLVLERGQTSGDIHRPTFAEELKDFFSDVGDFLEGFVKVLLYLIICGTPLVGVAALLFWLLFGKIGLIRKLFKKLK